ncbi:hypothetical protein CSOJ01_16047 [Colletotrichum sojae]|uniref:Uncharacterized protein n=1 Tax=Colletotrichum sojae TaxID=2175907 RepID=A0A8H6MG00_9PEZI|nr:hypothetical protein CSOJ01_16047 [Colletotrichum sojae]
MRRSRPRTQAHVLNVADSSEDKFIQYEDGCIYSHASVLHLGTQSQHQEHLIITLRGFLAGSSEQDQVWRSTSRYQTMSFVGSEIYDELETAKLLFALDNPRAAGVRMLVSCRKFEDSRTSTILAEFRLGFATDETFMPGLQAKFRELHQEAIHEHGKGSVEVSSLEEEIEYLTMFGEYGADSNVQHCHSRCEELIAANGTCIEDWSLRDKERFSHCQYLLFRYYSESGLQQTALNSLASALWGWEGHNSLKSMRTRVEMEYYLTRIGMMKEARWIKESVEQDIALYEADI